MPTYVVSCASTALTASNTQSLVLINPATIAYKITELSVSFDGAAAATAVEVQLYRTTAIGSPAGSSTTPIKVGSPSATAAQSTALTALTTEPTTVEILRRWFVSPASGLLLLQHPLGREPGAAGTGQQIGMRVITPSGVTPHAVGYLEFEE
jgi:hypothetical protein